MELELTSLPGMERTRLQPRLKSSQQDLSKLKSAYATALAKQNERNQLLDDATPDPDIASSDQRSRLLMGTQKLNDASRRLEESTKVALETEQIGISTLETLRTQREQMNRANNRVSLKCWFHTHHILVVG
jgi:vesicle transport through interaction with t-SNAREs protein 1